MSLILKVVGKSQTMPGYAPLPSPNAASTTVAQYVTFVSVDAAGVVVPGNAPFVVVVSAADYATYVVGAVATLPTPV